MRLHQPKRDDVANLFRRFRNNAFGVTAVEFGMLSPLFVMLLLAIIDYGAIFYAQSAVERALFRASEALSDKTTRPSTVAEVKAIICGEAQHLIDCHQPGFVVEVVPLTETSPHTPRPVSDAYTINPDQPAIVRLVYPWPNLLPKGALKTIGIPQTIDIQAGVFFYAKG